MNGFFPPPVSISPTVNGGSIKVLSAISSNYTSVSGCLKVEWGWGTKNFCQNGSSIQHVVDLYPAFREELNYI